MLHLTMKQLTRCAALVCTLAAPTLALAAPLTCPGLQDAVQVGTCPGEEELQYTYKGYCGDNNRLYGREAEICATYESYRKLKNVALWEAGKGEFSGYVSCELPAAKVKAATAKKLTSQRTGNQTRVSCAYTDDVVFSYRTKAQCKATGPTSAECGEGN